MPKALIIAEKPSVATDLQRALSPQLGRFSSKGQGRNTYFENDDYIICSAVGHLVELRLPTTAEGKSLPWKFDVLPVIPAEFEMQAIEGNKSRFNLLKKLMQRKDVELVINACDAGREGELIFRYIVSHAGIDKPVKRMWMQSMTDRSIVEAFASLRSDAEMTPLADAAMCRSEADWLVGINSSRAMTAYNSRWGGFNKTPVGRVQTPTLALLAKRESEIKAFKPEDYWEVFGDFGVEAGSYRGRWFDTGFKKDPAQPHGRASRIWEEAAAEAIRARCQGLPGTIEETKKPSKEAPPLLYDLTSLQRDASGRFGFSARRTLQIAQSLYERHKALTYPRTDSRFLPEDYLGTSKNTLGKIAAANGGTVENMPSYAAQAQGMVRPNRRIFDDKKVSDHFAIIPTGQIPRTLDEAERKIYTLVARRFIAAFFPAAEYELTRRVTHIGDDAFLTEGKVLTTPGWRAVYGAKLGGAAPGQESGTNKDKTIVAAKPGEPAENQGVEVVANQTRPPARYNEATLLRAMETAGKLVDEKELAEAMSERGLGTPATRAAIIEGLIKDGYILREGRDFYVPNRGLRLIDQLHRMEVGILTSPEMTGEWEHKLKQIEHGNFDRPSFMEEIKELTSKVVETARSYADEETTREWPRFNASCPACGAPDLAQDEGRYKCDAPDCKFTLGKVIASRPLSEGEARQLLTSKLAGPFDDFKSRFGQTFSATLELAEDDKGKLAATFAFEKSEDEIAESEAAKEEANKLCPCPLCGKGDIFETPTSYVCSHRIEGGGPKACKARLSRNMCKYDIPPEQARKYFTEGKTDLIDQFISKKGRPFSARLVCNKTGKRMLAWEFPPRKKAAKKAPKKATAKNPTHPT